ncbi:hypothetical protein J2755_001466 [Methanohalophilus levihalophilus]|uniref:hypothetical protein n=1 Tax=Methanohalophilus levihalophilus TaxID=1431282 RepID=UPI001AEA7368|nr:hypothetical protein [Methanohalophilus levihalophilus]MBP2030532.1 hypothetical protein [Methanohalophilus levihalophilus]
MGTRTILLVLLIVALGSISGVQAAKYFACGDDCADPETGYQLIGCTLAVNYAVENEIGVHVPSGSSNGYVYIQSMTEKDANGDVIYDEILACDYWKDGEPLPEETMGGEERDLLLEAVRTYNQNLGVLPGFVHSLLGDEVMHVYATMPDGSEQEYAAITETGLIVEGGNWVDFDEDGNYDVWKDEGITPTMELTIDAEGNISYEGLTTGTILKEFIIDIGMLIYSIFA